MNITIICKELSIRSNIDLDNFEKENLTFKDLEFHLGSKYENLQDLILSNQTDTYYISSNNQKTSINKNDKIADFTEKDIFVFYIETRNNKKHSQSNEKEHNNYQRTNRQKNKIPAKFIILAIILTVVIIAIISYFSNNNDNYSDEPINNEYYENEVDNNNDEQDNEFNNKNGVFVDDRDGHSYKWIKIGDQIWMAENLAYDAGNGCWAYDNLLNNVNKYGYLYNWETAKKSCPNGWHLPNSQEYEILLNNFGNGGNNDNADNFNGLLNSGFLPLYGGWRKNNAQYEMKGGEGYFWTSYQLDNVNAWYLRVSNDFSQAYIDGYKKDFGFSVRCIKDNNKNTSSNNQNNDKFSNKKAFNTSFQNRIGETYKKEPSFMSDYQIYSHFSFGSLSRTEFSGRIYSNDFSYFVLFEKFDKGTDKYELLDILEVSKNYYIASQSCRKNGQIDDEIVAVVFYEDTEYFEHIKKVWRFDKNEERIYEINNSGITCVNEDWGI